MPNCSTSSSGPTRRNPASDNRLTLQSLSMQNDEKGEELIKAAARGDTPAIQSLLAAGADPNARNEHGYTALIYVANRGDAGAVQALIEAGAEIDAHNEHGMTALMRAAFSEKTLNLVALIRAGADVNAEDINGQTALVWAKKTGREEHAEILIGAGANDSPSIQGDTLAQLKSKEKREAEPVPSDSLLSKLRRAFRIE